MTHQTRRPDQPRYLAGRRVQEVLREDRDTILFRDDAGQLWRYLWWYGHIVRIVEVVDNDR